MTRGYECFLHLANFHSNYYDPVPSSRNGNFGQVEFKNLLCVVFLNCHLLWHMAQAQAQRSAALPDPSDGPIDPSRQNFKFINLHHNLVSR